MKARYTKRLSARFMAALLSVLLAAGFLLGCAAPAETEDDGRMKVVTTIFPQYDFVRAIGGDLVHLRMLLSPGEEMHSYEPTPLDIKEIQNCDLFIYVGGENDVWVDRILDNMGDHRPETLRLVDLTDTVEEEIVEGMMEERGHEHDHDEADHHEDGDHDEEVDHHEDDDHDEVDHDEDEHRHGGDSSHEEHEEADEHVWTSPVKAAEITEATSPVKAAEITEAIAAKMAEIDPANAAQYREGAHAYAAQLMDLDARFREIVGNAERKTIVFGDRFPIRYFAEEYGLEYYAAFPGCSAETEPSASTLAFLIDKVREEEIPVVFSIELSNGNIAKAICESGGAVQRTFYSCHNLTREQMESGATYVSMMTENLEVLEEALGRKAESK